MLEIKLQEPSLVQEIENLVTREGIDAAKFVADAVRKELAQHRQKQIAAETAAWYAFAPEQRNRYTGKFVAVYGGAIVDSDIDQMTLHFRAIIMRQKLYLGGTSLTA